MDERIVRIGGVERAIDKLETKDIDNIRRWSPKTGQHVKLWVRPKRKDPTWDKADLKGRVIRLEAGDTKDKQARNVPICEDLYKILLREANPLRKAEDDNHVIPYDGKPIQDPRAAIRNACEKAKIPWNGITFNDWRHIFNTLMRKAGVHDTVIMEITGHSTMEMFQRYNTVDGEDTREAARWFGIFVDGVR